MHNSAHRMQRVRLLKDTTLACRQTWLVSLVTETRGNLEKDAFVQNAQGATMLLIQQGLAEGCWSNCTNRNHTNATDPRTLQKDAVGPCTTTASSRRCQAVALPLVPAEPATAVICNGMIQVSALQIFHDQQSAVRLQACPDELHNVAVMAALQNGYLLLENI